MYYPYDVFRLKMVKQDAVSVARKIWSQLSEPQRESIAEGLNVDIGLPPEWEVVKEKLSSYRKGDMSYKDCLPIFLELLR